MMKDQLGFLCREILRKRSMGKFLDSLMPSGPQPEWSLSQRVCVFEFVYCSLSVQHGHFPFVDVEEDPEQFGVCIACKEAAFTIAASLEAGILRQVSNGMMSLLKTEEAMEKAASKDPDERGA